SRAPSARSTSASRCPASCGCWRPAGGGESPPGCESEGPSMATVLKIGPWDHGRPMTLEEFTAGDYEEGYQYELIDGKLYVSPRPHRPQGLTENWLFRALLAYSAAPPDVLNMVFPNARVFVPGRPGVTNPEPDVAAYHDFPLDLPFREARWQDFSPVLVVEVLS